jgi:hypothetical protein
VYEGSCHCGSVRWTLDGSPDSATACSCTICRRYGALWAYGHENEDVRVSGETHAYSWGDRDLGFYFCPTCACLAYWRAIEPNEAGRRRVGVNLRMAEPASVSRIPIRHLDGLETWRALRSDGRCVADMWF